MLSKGIDDRSELNFFYECGSRRKIDNRFSQTNFKLRILNL